jgi:hypothetical protein
MATYTVSSGQLICTGTDITTSGIVTAVNSNSGSLNTVGGSSASATTTLTEHGYRTSTINADFYIGDGSTASTWVAENESITVWANIIGFNNANVRFGLKNVNGTYSNPVFFSYDSTNNAGNSTGWERWQLTNGGHFEAYVSTIICDNLLTYERSMGDVTFERCYLSIIDGLGEGSGTYNTTGSPTVTYIDCLIDNHVGVGLKLYQGINYVLNKVSITNNTYGIQPGRDPIVLVDSNLNTNNLHSVPNVADCDVTLINSDITTLRVTFSSPADIHRLVQRFDYQSVDASGSALSGVLVRIIDQTGSIVVNNESTDAFGRVSTLPTYNGIKCLQYKTYAGITETLKDNHTFLSYKYGYGLTAKAILVQPGVDIVEKDFKINDVSITETTKATVDAYTEIDTSAKFYDRTSSYLEDNLGTYLDFIVTRSGDLIDAGAYNVTIDATAASVFNVTGNLITIKASTYTGDMVTTGIITLANGAVFDGIRTDANGTVYPPQPITITNISAGSRLRLYNVTTDTETVNTVVLGTSYTSSYQEGVDYTDGDLVSVYLEKPDYNEWVGNVVDTSNGFNVLASQEIDPIYVLFNIDGSTITKFQADYPNNEVDLTVASNWTMAELYAWWKFNLATEQGIRNFFGGITAIDAVNFRINTAIVNLYLDNGTNASYRQTDNRRFFRDTGDGYPVRNPTTSGYGLDVVWRGTVTPYYNTLPPTVTEIRTELDNNSEILSDILEDTNALNTNINYSESDEVFDETAANEL